MDVPLCNRPTDPNQKHLNLRLTPSQDARKPRQAEALDAVEEVDLRPASNLLEPLVLRPRVQRDFIHALLDVDEARLLVPALQLVRDPNRPTERHSRVVEVAGPLEEGKVRPHGAVVAERGGVGFLALHVTAGLEVLEGAGDDGAKVFEAAEQDAGVDVGEVGGRVEPVRLGGVVDEEVDVGGDGGGLNGREVGADDGGGREEVGHVDGPDAGAGADVEDPFGFVQGCVVDSSAVDAFDEFVLQVETFEFGWVVGEAVGCNRVAVSVVMVL